MRAADHDLGHAAVLTPLGILEVDHQQSNLIFGTSRDTADFVADGLELWWTNRKATHPDIRRIFFLSQSLFLSA